MNEILFAAFLVGMMEAAHSTAQVPVIGVPTLIPAGPVSIMRPPLVHRDDGAIRWLN